MVSHLNSSPSGTPSNFFQAPLPFLLAPTSESSHILTENIKPIPIYHVWKTAHWLNTYHPCIFRPASRYEIVMVNMPSLVNMPLLSPGKWWKCTTLLSLKSNFTATHPKYGKIYVNRMSGNFLSNFGVIYSSGTLESNHSKISKVPRHKKNKETKTRKNKPFTRYVGRRHLTKMSGSYMSIKVRWWYAPLMVWNLAEATLQRIHISQEIANIFTKTFKRSYKDCQRCLSFKDRESSKTFINILKRSLLCSSHKWKNKYL